jgi:hypothetical protein
VFYESIGQQFGRYYCHAEYATSLSGVTREVRIATPEFDTADFDAMDHGDTLYEVKTGYRWLPFTPDAQLRQDIVTRFYNQATNQLIVAETCGHPLVWYFNDPVAASFFGAENAPNRQEYERIRLPVRVLYVPFRCSPRQR